MSKKDIYRKPFDEGTLTKLEIFEEYLEAWLPTFIMSRFNKRIQVFDLFAGVGYDKNNIKGSPIRILDIIKKYEKLLNDTKKKVYLYLNDYDNKKVSLLKNNIENTINELGIKAIVEIKITNEEFKNFLKKYESIFDKGCNLIFIDQNGFKEVTENIFQFLISFPTTDFIFFISSNHIRRFSNSNKVQEIHPKFDFDKIRNTNFKFVHNVICEEFKKYIPANKKCCILYPFSIMKEDNNNVYGLIFVTKNLLGADKFLNVAWNKNRINGNANFDINEDIAKSQIELFISKTFTKIEFFQKGLEENILSKKITNNIDAYMYTIYNGHVHKHAVDLIKKMKKEGKIYYNSKSPLVSYNNAVKYIKKIKYIVNNELIL